MSNIRGPKPKPTVMHVLNGNPGKRDISDKIKLEEMIQKFDDYPEAPAWIQKNKIAYEEWNRVVPRLVDVGLLTQNDTSALEAYCKCYSRYREAEEEMDRLNTTYFKTPQGYVQQLPQISIAQKYLRLAKEFMTEFGLTPSARGRMLLPGETEDGDQMEILLKEVEEIDR